MTLSIAITSGKGGVGKTNTAVSLAVALGQTGKDILLFDADFGLANTHVLLGTKPSKSVADFLDKKMLNGRQHHQFQRWREHSFRWIRPY